MRSKIFILTVTVGLYAANGYALDKISEILPSGKLLICVDGNERIVGNKVEVYSDRKEKSQRRDKLSEYNIPSVGTKVELIHDEIHMKEKRAGDSHTVSLGFATITNADLAGEMRNSMTSTKVPKQVTKKLSKEDAATLKEECLVAETDVKDVYVGAKIKFAK